MSYRVEEEKYMLAMIGGNGIKILLTLLEQGPLHITALLGQSGVSHGGYMRPLNVLQSLGLVRIEKIGKLKIVDLTSRGAYVADNLKKIEEYIRLESQ